MKTFVKKYAFELFIFGVLWIFTIYGFIASKTTYRDQSIQVTDAEFRKNAEVIVNNDRVGAGITLKEVIHGVDGLTYRYIVKTDCPSWDFETRYTSDKPIEWADEYASAEVVIYDTQIRYKGSVYANGQYYTVPILGGISSETVSIEEWKNGLMKQAYQSYTFKVNETKKMRSALLSISIVMPISVIIIFINWKKKE